MPAHPEHQMTTPTDAILEYVQTEIGAVRDVGSQHSAAIKRLEAGFESLNTFLRETLPQRPQTPAPMQETPSEPREEDPSTPAVADAPLEKPPPKSIPLKVALPEPFNRDREKGQAFLNSCELYFRLQAGAFPDDQVRIHWVLMQMKSGRAAIFADRVIRHEAHEGQEICFADWKGFVTEFKMQFCPLYENVTAITKLEGTRYFQGHRALEDYIDEVQTLLDKSGYVDPLTHVVKFRRGLDPTLQSQIAEITMGRPGDNDLEGWKFAARRIDQNRQANEAFRATNPGRASTTAAVAPKPAPKPFHTTRVTETPSASTSMSTTRAPTAPAPIRPQFAHLKPSPGNPIPMDVDAGRRQWVRGLNAEDRSAFIELLMAAEDTADLEAKSLTDTSMEPPSVVEEVQDFRNGEL